jgi:uncharacterized protein (TIGR03545 family)
MEEHAMRWMWLIPRLLLVALVWGFLNYGLDPLLQRGLVSSLQSVTGARVDVAAVQTTFLPPSITLRNVALAKPGGRHRNIVQFDSLELKLEPDSLSRRKFVVESGRIDGLVFDTARLDDGTLEVEADSADSEPSWIGEQVTELGSGWLDGLHSAVREQLDPERLETYRTGRGLYDKWELRFEELELQARSFEPRAKQLRDQFDAAREGDVLQQIEQYLQVARQAELLVVDAQAFREQLTGIVPEVRTDFASLNAARQRDQELVRHSLSLLKPDARRISQALLGPTLHRQLQQALVWINAASEYQQSLTGQTRPPRSRGRDIEFVLRQPSPDFVLRNLGLTGSLSVDGSLIPFQAELRNVTEDPKLLGHPCVLQLQTAGPSPLRMKWTWDRTQDVPSSELIAAWSRLSPLPFRAGSGDSTALRGTFAGLAWNAALRIESGRIDGTLHLASDVERLDLLAGDRLNPHLLAAANESLAGIQSINATLNLSGPLLRPSLELKSDLGEQVATGLQQAFASQLNLAKDRLIADVNSYAADEVQKLKERFAREYDQLLAENAELLTQINEVRTLVAAAQSGRLDAASVLKQASQSKLLNEKDRRKVNEVLDKASRFLPPRR